MAVGGEVAPRLARGLLADRPAQLILGVSLLIRVGLVGVVSGLGLEIQDERHYYALADNLLNGRGFALEGGQLTSLRPPLYPAFIAGVWSIAGDQSLTVIRLAQVLLSLITGILVYDLGRLLFNQRVARWALAGATFYPSLIFADLLLLTEPLFTFFLVVAANLYVRLVAAPRVITAGALGAAVAAAALTRSVLWPFPLVLVPMLIWAVTGSASRKLGVATLVLASYAAVIAPWSIRNTRLQGTFTLVDTMGGLNLRMGNYKDTPDDRMWAVVGLNGERDFSHDLLRERPDARTMTEGQKEQWARQKAIEYMRQHPLVTLRRTVIRFADFWGLEREFVAGVEHGVYRPPVWATVVIAVLIGVSYPLAMAFATLGVFLAPPSDRRTHVFLLAVVAFICGLHTLVFGHSRYHLPVMPILLLYAASAFVNLRPALARLRTTAGLPVLATVAVLAVIWTRQLFVADAARIRHLLDVLR